MIRNRIAASAAADIEAMSRTYLWWNAIAEDGHSLERMIAQIMRLGTYKDIRRLEAMVTPDLLAAVLVDSAPGWFDDRSWAFWRGRLSHAGVAEIPERRPQRTFAHADML
jgi:hypothetical protein